MEEENKKFMGLQFSGDSSDIPEENKYSMIMHFLSFEPSIHKFEEDTRYTFFFKKEDLKRMYSEFKRIVKYIESIPEINSEK